MTAYYTFKKPITLGEVRNFIAYIEYEFTNRTYHSSEINIRPMFGDDFSEDDINDNIIECFKVNEDDLMEIELMERMKMYFNTYYTIDGER